MPADDASTRFPFINLEKALERANAIYEGDRACKAMPVATAFDLWGYSPKSSGGFQTTGALRGYGLLEAEGSNADRKLKLSSAARRYFLDERDDSRAKMLVDFALSPPLFRALWDKDQWSEGIPADTVARSHLKIERHLNDQSARAVLGIFKDNLSFANLRGGAQPEEPVESPRSEADASAGPFERKRGEAMERQSAGMTQNVSGQAAVKPIVFDMETLTVTATFDNGNDLDAFIEKLQKIRPLMPSKD